MALSRPKALPSNWETAVFLDMCAVRGSSESLPGIIQSPWEDPSSTSCGYILSEMSEDWPLNSPSNAPGFDIDFLSAVAFADLKMRKQVEIWKMQKGHSRYTEQYKYLTKTIVLPFTFLHSKVKPCIITSSNFHFNPHVLSKGLFWTPSDWSMA